MNGTNLDASRYVKVISKNPEMSHNKILRRISRGSTVLEFGPASGVMTKVLHDEMGCQVSVVEIDRECFENLKPWIANGVCCDIETYEWCDQLEEHSFDFILFADVLEHLREPERVLRKAMRYLKDIGSIFISVPNIAHNSVLIDLWNNQLSYQKTGILDVTHIHHFTFLELLNTCQDVGYFPIYMDAVYIAVGRNEFSCNYGDIDYHIQKSLEQRPFGEVYQFIFEIKKREYVLDKKIIIENRLETKKDYLTLMDKWEEKKANRWNHQSDYNLLLTLFANNPNELMKYNTEIASLQTKLNEFYEDTDKKKTLQYKEEIKEKEENIHRLHAHLKELDSEIEKKDKRIVQLQDEVQERNDHISVLDKKINGLDKEISDLNKEISGLDKQIINLDKEINILNKEIEKLHIEVEDGDKLIQEQKELLTAYRENQKLLISGYEKEDKREQFFLSQWEKKEKERMDLKEENMNLKQERKSCQKQILKLQMELQKELQNTTKENLKWKELLDGQEKQRNEKENHILKLEKEIRELKESLAEQSRDIKELTVAEEIYEERYKIAEQEYQNIKTEWDAYQKEKQQLQQIIRNKEGHIELLLESDRELERIKHSKSWKYMEVLWKAAGIFVPPNSKRRLFGKLCVKGITHPVRFLKLLLTPRKLRNFFYYLKKDGAGFVAARLDESMIGVRVKQPNYEIEELKEEAQEDIHTYQPLSFKRQENPLVSIIIPVYNQFSYTYQCLKSILKNSGEISYEIILANDHSTDLTQQILEIVSNITMITNTENLRFLKNCNHAAKSAKGTYLLFLNNDTQVQENWLKPLVDLIESEESIGMVGSKLVYADGRLQEAGGIIWRDGSAWNYGNGSDPTAPEYNYVKEVDYISGAAILIKKKLWEAIGGFDERFAPAYCEDSDFAFEVRRHGYKVMYQPLSVVIHFEGVSNGTDINSGQKSYQALNQQKFFEKWKDVLYKEHYPNGEMVFSARDRSKEKQVLLMVDHYVPQYDKDAGSRTVFQYLRLFVKKEFHVKFIGDNFYKHEPYTTRLQQMGIEVLYGPYYANNWKKWIKENGKISYIFLNRPHISVKYIDFVRENTEAKIFYYGHDLHFLREARKYELTRERKALSDSKDWKEKEFALMRKADMVYYPSPIEIEEIHKIDPSIPAKAITAYMFDDIKEKDYQIEKRSGLMFVGGFTHTPNVDAVLWLAEKIMPIVTAKRPDIKIFILGSNPPEEITALNGEHIIIKGFVSDEELANFYEESRIAVVPLRYGAGIKGKVVEAMKFGIPTITTSVGAEGIENIDSVLCIADDAQQMAQKIIELYEDEETLQIMVKNGYQYVKENFSIERAASIIADDFGIEKTVYK